MLENTPESSLASTVDLSSSNFVLVLSFGDGEGTEGGERREMLAVVCA